MENSPTEKIIGTKKVPNRIYPMAKSLAQLAKLLNFSAEKALRRAGLPHDYLLAKEKGLTPKQVFDLWCAMDTEVNCPDLPLRMAQLFAHGPFTPAMFSFSCSPDLRTGLKRLSVFKPLMGPLRLDVSEDDDGVHVGIASVAKDAKAPASMVWFEALYLIESARCYTGERIVPKQVVLPELPFAGKDVVSFLGCIPQIGALASMSFKAEDAAQQLISSNSEAWPDFERHLRRELEIRQGAMPMAVRVKRALHDLLPAGEAGIDVLCRRLAVSKRSLQRQLQEEGESFQMLLSATRMELAQQYLSDDDLNVEQISYLLAYREPNSFYRAFHAWTGLTPAEARALRNAI